MRVRETELPGVFLVSLDTHRDVRGAFTETYAAARYAALGIPGPFVQDNCTLSHEGVLRGLHLQREEAQGKLVTCLRGRIYDVAVDVRRGSAHFAQWYGRELSQENSEQLYIPEGFAHGFCVLSPDALVHYKCTRAYAPQHELTLAWNDPRIGIEWPLRSPSLSERDRLGLSLAEAFERLPALS